MFWLYLYHLKHSQSVARSHALGNQTLGTCFALLSLTWPRAAWFFFIFFIFFFCSQLFLGVRGLPPAERRLTLPRRCYLVSFRQLPWVEVFNIALINGFAFRIMANPVRSCISRNAGKLGCCVRLFSQAMQWPFSKVSFAHTKHPQQHLSAVNRHSFLQGIILNISKRCMVCILNSLLDSLWFTMP